MKFKHIVLFILLISVVIISGVGLAQKAYSARRGDDPYPPLASDTYPPHADIPLGQQVGGTSGIILGAIAIVLIIGAGVGFNSWARGSER